MKKIIIVFIIILLIISCDDKSSLFITNVNIVDVENGQIINDQVIVIEEGIITSIINNNTSLTDPDNTIDVNGMYVTPGLSDMNVFLDEKMTDIDYWGGLHPGDQMIAAGITTIRLRRYFKDPRVLIENEDEIRGNITIGPDIIKPTIANYTSGKDIENLIGEIKYAEADFINLLSFISAEQMDNILNYADEHNIYTYGNIYSFQDFLRSSKIGFDELEKIELFNILLMDKEFVKTIDWFNEKDFWKKFDQYYSKYYNMKEEEIEKAIKPKLDQIINIMKKNNIAVSTSLFVSEISRLKLSNYDEYFKYAEKYKIPERADSIYLWTKTVLGDHIRLEMIPDYVKFLPIIGEIILTHLKENEIMILASTSFTSDAWYGIAPGLSLHDELKIMLDCGFSNLEALQTATLNASKMGDKMGLEEKWGIIKPGYRADLVFTKDNPLENIDYLRSPECVMKSGVMYDNETIQSLR